MFWRKSLRTTVYLIYWEIIERCFEDCKSQINSKIVGIGQPTKGEER